MRQRGFTLLEILGILLVITVLAAIGINNFLSYQRSLTLRQAATQVATDLNRIRTEARRTSQNWILWVNPSSPTTYVYGPQSNTPSATDSGITAGQARSASLPTGLQLQISGNNWVRFTAPYGVNASASSQVATVSRISAPTTQKINVNIVGVIGKVVVR